MEILVGDNPFIGVSHLSQEKARVEAEHSSLENKVRVLEAAVDAGATGFTFSTHPANLELLEELGRRDTGVIESLDYYILTPYAYSYVARASAEGTARLARSILRELAGGGLVSLAGGLLARDPARLAALFLEHEAKPYLRLLPEGRVKALLLHEVPTEIMLSFRLTDLYFRLKGLVEDRLHVRLGLETRNMGFLASLFERKPAPSYIMTPLNPLGFQMAPSRNMAEEAVRRLSGASRIIAISILAAGAIGMEEALSYLSGFKHHLHAVVTASTRPGRIASNVEALRSLG